MKFSLRSTLSTALITSSLLFTPVAHAGNFLDVLQQGAQIASIYQKQAEDIRYLDGVGRLEMLKEQMAKTGVDNSSPANRQLREIMTRFHTALRPVEPSLHNKSFNYYVNPSEEFNAFCTLGHNLSVNRGVFTFTNYNTDEVAAVVAHELAHGIKEHPKKGAFKSMNVAVLKELYAAQNPSRISILGANVVSANIQNRGITKPMEKEADQLSFFYVVNAGFNVGAPAAIWQRFIDKSGTHKQIFIGELFAPANHPGNQWRRDNFAKLLTQFSHNKITVDSNNGMIKINGKDAFIPAPVGDMTSQERAFLVAGNLSAVYHNNNVIPAATRQGNYIYMGKQPILSLAAGDNPQKIINAINSIR